MRECQAAERAAQKAVRKARPVRDVEKGGYERASELARLTCF
jgi:hypothetical protein